MFWKKPTKLQKIAQRIKHRLHDVFVPHEGNNHRPHIIHHRALIVYSFLLVGIKIVAIGLTLTLPASSVFSSAISGGNIMNLTNAARVGVGLQELSWNSALASAAQLKANDMALHEYFAHTSPTGATPWYWIRSAGYVYTYAGENLAVHFTQAEDVTAGWMASPTHKANILEPRFEEIGVGVSYGRYQDYETTFVVEMFGVNENVVEPVVAAAEEELPFDPVEEPQIEPVEDANPVEPIETPVENSNPESQVQNVEVLPAENAYTVEVDVPGAESVVLEFSGEITELENMQGDTWAGTLTYNEQLIDNNGESINLVAVNQDGDQTIEAISYVAPASEADDFYTLSTADGRSGFFGFLTVKNVNDAVQVIFLITALILGAVVLLTMLVKTEKKKHTMLAHVLTVLILVLGLSVL